SSQERTEAGLTTKVNEFYTTMRGIRNDITGLNINFERTRGLFVLNEIRAHHQANRVTTVEGNANNLANRVTNVEGSAATTGAAVDSIVR
ncbi:hypothetical protein MKW92_018945, partial [Papaver armeniacum]